MVITVEGAIMTPVVDQGEPVLSPMLNEMVIKLHQKHLPKGEKG